MNITEIDLSMISSYLLALAIGFLVGALVGYVLCLKINKLNWNIKPFIVIPTLFLWVIVMIARLINPEINIGITFDLIVGGVLGSSMNFNFGELIGNIFNKQSKNESTDKK